MSWSGHYKPRREETFVSAFYVIFIEPTVMFVSEKHDLYANIYWLNLWVYFVGTMGDRENSRLCKLKPLKKIT